MTAWDPESKIQFESRIAVSIVPLREVFQNRTLLMERSLILISSLNIETFGSPYPPAYVRKCFNMSELGVSRFLLNHLHRLPEN